MYKKILVPIDGSELSYQAVEGAAKFCLLYTSDAADEP